MWEEMPEAHRQQYEKQGIRNVAQMRTLGHYTERFVREESRAMLENIRRAKFAMNP